MKQGIFVETKNVAAFRRGVETLTNRDRYQPGFMVVQGESGRGKSQAAINWHGQNGGVFLRVWEGWSQHAFLQALAFEVTGGRVHCVFQCKREVVDFLSADPAPIIVDEADRLDIRRIEDLRDVHEATGVSIVLIGEEAFFPKLKSRQRIYSRVAEVINFAPVEKGDIVLYAAQAADLKVSPEAAAFLAAEVHGSFRLVHNLVAKLEAFAKASNVDVIDMDALAGAGLAKKKGGRK